MFIVVIGLALKKFFFSANLQYNSEDQTLDIIEKNSNWINYNFEKYQSSYINTNFLRFGYDDNILSIKTSGFYKLEFTIMAYIDASFLPENDDQNTNDSINEIKPVDYTIEWRIVDDDYNELLKEIPAFSNNRTDGAENSNTITKIVYLKRHSNIIIQYRNPEERDAELYKIKILNLCLTKI